MTTLLSNALEAIHGRVNVSDGGTHPMDKDTINETFNRLHDAGEILVKAEIQDWLIEKGWKDDHADRVASTAQQIGEGKRGIVKDGPCWKEDIVEIWLEGDA
jgi:hypothetical protein